MVPDRDEDLELALSLHRELNGLTRRSRQPSRNYESALQNLKKRREEDGKPSTTSSGSGSKRRSAGREEDSKDAQRLKKLKSLRLSSSEGSDLSEPSSSPQDNHSRDHHSSDRKASGHAAQRSSQLGDPGLAAAAGAAGAQQARSKAAKVAAAAAGGGGGASNHIAAAASNHVKCFFAGIRWGALLPLVALKDRASLVAAVSKAFEQDGVRCSEASAHVIFVTADQQTLEFPGRAKHGEAAVGGARVGEWDAAARKAIRIYVR